MSNNRERIKQILVIVATGGVILINYLAAVGLVNNISPAAISAKYPTLITPAGYAFSIWGLIYFGLMVFSIYQVLPKNAEKFRLLRTVYILNCAANCLWIYCWHHEMPVICLGIIFLLLGTLAFINVGLQKTDSYSEYWLAKAPLGLYFGWVTAAAILNAAVALVYLNVQVSDSTGEILGAVLLLAAGVLGVIICLKLKNYFYPLGIAWALTAIAVEHGGHTLIISAAAGGVSVCLLAALSFVMFMKSSEIR
ncbi:MAG: hypothetical protein ACR2LT_04715 [Pyrinomonadaceae bacterium]